MLKYGQGMDRFKTFSLLMLGATMKYTCWSYGATDQNNHSTIEEKRITKKNLGKVLIVYYLLDGNTRRVVDAIQKMINATVQKIDIFLAIFRL
jgi:hypothetical protein